MFNHEIDNLIIRYLNKNIDSKISFGIIINDKQYYFDYDINGINNNIYEYEIGSISKTFTAHLVMKYVCDGLIDLNKSVGYYLNIGDYYPTIYELLTHTTGYRHLTPIEFTLKNILKYYKKNLYENIKSDDVLKSLIKRKMKRSHNYYYSDFNYAILAVMLEKITNKSFSYLFEDFINNDLHFKNTKLLSNYIPNTKAIYKSKEIKRWNWKNDNPYLSAGGISSNIYDMVEYMKIQLLSEENYILKCHITNNKTKIRKDRILICPGWHAYKNGNHLWHVGGVGCYRSSIIISKNKMIGVVGLGNSCGKRNSNVHYLVKKIYSFLTRNRNKF